MLTAAEVFEYCGHLEKILDERDGEMSDREVDHLMSLLDEGAPYQWYLNGERSSTIGNALCFVGSIMNSYAPANRVRKGTS